MFDLRWLVSLSAYVGRIRSSLVPFSIGSRRICRASWFHVSNGPKGMLSLKLHGTPLPASRAQVGNSWWKNWFHRFISSFVKQKYTRLARRTTDVPLVAFLGLVHLGDMRLGLVLGRGRSGDQRGIDNRATGDIDSVGLQQGSQPGEHRLAVILLL